MMSSPVDEIEHRRRKWHARQESDESGEEYFRIMVYTVVTIIAASIATVAAGFLVAGYQQANRTLMIYSGLVVWIFTGATIAATLLRDAPQSSAPSQIEQTRLKAIAAQQRSYIQIAGFVLAIGRDGTQVVFRLTVDGPTYVDIESGEIGISIDDPPLSSEDRSKGLYTAKIKPQRIVPRQQEIQMVQVAALPAIYRERLLKGPPTEVFYVGEILYWDAFKDTGTPRHRREFAYGVTDGRIRPLDLSIWARNNETDDP